MGAFDVAARHAGVPGGQGRHSELVQQSAACYSDKYGHQDTWQWRRREREEGERTAEVKCHRGDPVRAEVARLLSIGVLGQNLVLYDEPRLHDW